MPASANQRMTDPHMTDPHMSVYYFDQSSIDYNNKTVGSHC